MDVTHIPQSIRGDPWFEDGNIILLADSEDSTAVAFKVHRGVLARHSEVFQSMFEGAQPNEESFEHCPVVRLHDIPVELSNLIKALYDGPHGLYHLRGIQDFFYFAGILRISSKYCIAHLRTQAIRHLMQTWSHTLRGHDDMLERALNTPEEAGLSYPYVHPLHVLNLAKATDVRIVVPSAVYFLSLYPLADILRGEHPKLLVEHPSRPSSQLTTEDLQNYTLMFQYRVQLILHFVRKTCGARLPIQKCSNVTGCRKSFSQLSNRLAREWLPRTGPIHFMSQAVDELTDFPEICGPCRAAFKKDVKVAREEAWNNLPMAISLPPWDQLEAAEFAKS
ncbi:hypothetical protein BDY19DRAFT_892287 [Irpex rosettiformis]|uniref:Uncharacterized protein n=1 Tax=Irpex rosettiformis TaxID=378272 RepID=A0ACB8U089_9APHY|nr:hypothetical protein BDY19DRAFT_892287 [Irpex rosettiformis]